MANGGNGSGSAQTGDLLLLTESTESEALEDFDALYRECRPVLILYAERRNARDAELLADLALIDVYRAKDRLRSDHPRVIWAYLYRAIDNHLKREGAAFLPELRTDLEELGGSYSFEEDVIGDLSLDDMLAMLSSNQQLALRPKLEENLSADEIGARMGKSADAVRQLQHKAIRRLRRILFVAAMVLVVLLAAVLSERDVVVDQSPATSGTEQLPPETTVPDQPVPDRPASGEATLEVTETSVPAAQTPAGDGVASGQSAQPRAADAGAAPTEAPAATVPEAEQPVAVAEPAAAEPESPASVQDPGPDIGSLTGSFALVNAESGNCVDQPWNQDDGGRVIQWVCAGHTALNQILVATAGNGGTMLAFSHSGKCLDESNQIISQWTCHGGDNQLFAWNGAQLQSKETGLCLTLLTEAAGNGSTLRTTPCANSLSQQFRLERYGGQLAVG